MHLYIPVWIDLKKKPSAHSTGEFFTLHSSMDRFKGVLQNISTFLYILYIPVWIDLKFKKYAKDVPPEITLHSSMDRFEGCAVANTHLPS